MAERLRIAGCALALALVGPLVGSASPALAADTAPQVENQTPAHGVKWQCAQFARMFSGINLFGDAWTWWNQALGKYARGFTPETGSVLVFKPYGPMSRGHVAVVSQVITDRIIQVTHANWSPIAGHRGKVEKDVTVVDVSDKGDWSQVKVFYDPTGELGTTRYPTYGFVYKAATDALNAAKAAMGGTRGATLAAAVSDVQP